MSRFTSWQSVKVADESLESHDKAGVVKSATEYTHEGAEVVDVQLDGETEVTTFGVDQVAVI